MFGYTLWRISLGPPHRSHCPSHISKTRRTSRPDLTICLEALYDHLPLGLVIHQYTCLRQQG
jgi:hypothetical protein